MSLRSDAAMVLFYDIDGDTADHDDWHSYEHLHERLSVLGFLSATRWITKEGGPHYMIIYEVSGTDVATSQSYLHRLNDPTEWTRAMMPRFRGMTRGFCTVVASSGFGFGAAAMALRFRPEDGTEPALTNWLATEVLPPMVNLRGIAGAHLLRPAAPPPMTREQALRGVDRPMPWLAIVTGYDAAALDRTIADCLAPDALGTRGATDLSYSRFFMHHTADRDEVKRTAKPPLLTPQGRRLSR